MKEKSRREGGKGKPVEGGFSKGGSTAGPSELSGFATSRVPTGTERVHPRGSGAQRKIDVFCHVAPKKLTEAFEKKDIRAVHFRTGRYGLLPYPAMEDMEARIRIMDRYEGYVQILTLSLPPVEDVASPKVAIDLAAIANDAMAEIVYKYPDRFLAAVACLPLSDMSATMKELERAIFGLGFKGVQINSTIMDKPLDSPEFEPLFEKMNEVNLPILIHPRTALTGPRAFKEQGLPFVETWSRNPFNWPIETTVAMGTLVYSGILARYPNLKIVTHHLGGVVPYQHKRILNQWDGSSTRHRPESRPIWKYPLLPVEYYKMMYGDTALYGNTHGLMCGYDFFGADHVLFATDFPYDHEGGDYVVRETINSVEEMDISEEDRYKIYEGNARRLFRLPG